MRDFLRALWPQPIQGDLTIWLNPSKNSLHKALNDVLTATDEDLEELAQINRDGQNVYFSLGLRREGLGSSKRGGKQDVIALPGFTLDFDFFHPSYPEAHKATNLPTEDEVWDLFASAKCDPSLIVRSGHGLQPTWVFERPIILDSASKRTQAQTAYKAFQQPFVELAAQRGWQLDNVASIERVWRLPGFINHKSGQLTTLLHSSYDRYSLGELAPPGSRSAPKALREATAIPSVDPIPATDDADADSLEPVDHPTAPLDVVEALHDLSAGNKNKKLISLVLAGKSFAKKGARDEALHRACSVIGFHSASAPYDAETLAEILRVSLTCWADEDGATKTADEEMAKAAEKMQRVLQEKADKVEADRKKFSGLQSSVRVAEPAAAEEVVTESDSIEFASHHAVIQVRSSFWIYDFREERYVGPKTKDEILTFARDAWREGPSTLSLSDLIKKKEVYKSLPQVMREYGTVAKDVIGKFTIDKSYYDVESKNFFEATAPLRVTEPVYNEKIAQWLALLGGDHLDKLLDWIAAVPQLDRQCCALYLDGHPGAGKGMLASGLARLWREGGATPLENVLGSFNAEMFKCPLLFLDEGLPSSAGNVSAEIRRLIGSSNHSLTEKYVVNRTVIGSVRLLICANNDNVLSFGEENVSANDLEAYIGRFMHIPVHQKVVGWLADNGGWSLTTPWVEEDLIAKHCLWLALERNIIPGRRFLVEGTSVAEMHRKLVMQGDGSGQVYEWLARFASNPTSLYLSYQTKKTTPLALVGDGEILVNTQGLLDNWTTYMTDDVRRPTTTKVGSTLGKLSAGISRRGHRGARHRYHQIRPDLVMGWIVENQIGDEDAVSDNLKNSLPEEKS